MQQHFVGVLILLDIDHATESGKRIRAHTLSGCNRIMSGSTGTGVCTILLMIITFAFILYAAVKSIQEQHHLHH